ncbi:MAG TPA: hypothetical protein VII92_07645, partial [Anaerolineae bacterium]
MDLGSQWPTTECLLAPEATTVGTTLWRGQTYRALKAIDCLGQLKQVAKQEQGRVAGQAAERINRQRFEAMALRNDRQFAGMR